MYGDYSPQCKSKEKALAEQEIFLKMLIKCKYINQLPSNKIQFYTSIHHRMLQIHFPLYFKISQ